MVQMTAAQIDALAIAFTVFASIWLVLALIYLVTVCLFFRMGGRGDLRGSMSDPAWGRVYLMGETYIPMGWLFRRYVMFQRSGEDRARIAKIRVMSVEERRAAVEELLRPNKSCCTNGISRSTQATSAESKPTRERVPGENTLDQRPFEQCSMEEGHMSLDVPSEEVGAKNNSELHDPNTVRGRGPEVCFAERKIPQTSARSLSVSSSASGMNEEDDEENTCPICFASCSQQGPCFDSPVCPHRFHWSCILAWLEFQSHRECPCCRIELVSEEDIWQIVREQRRNKETTSNSKDTTVVQASTHKQSQNNQSDADNSSLSIREAATDNKEDVESSIVRERHHLQDSELVIKTGLGTESQHVAPQQNSRSEITSQEAKSRTMVSFSVRYFDLESQEIPSQAPSTKEVEFALLQDGAHPQNVIRERPNNKKEPIQPDVKTTMAESSIQEDVNSLPKQAFTAKSEILPVSELES